LKGSKAVAVVVAASELVSTVCGIAAHDDAALFVDEEEIAVTNPIIEGVGAGLEALFYCSELFAILEARGLGCEPCAADFAIVML
jgi:hypothetical protein